jgi:hypothetical protein
LLGNFVMDRNLIEIPAVEIVAESMRTVTCRVGRTKVELARVHFAPGTEVVHVGDRGKAFLPYALAVLSGMARGRSAATADSPP